MAKYQLMNSYELLIKMKLLGIKNCDTVRKARKWLEANDIDFDFVDIRDTPVSKAEWKTIVANTDIEVLVNKRGTSWRKLDADAKDISSANKVINLLVENPTVMKRPLLINGSTYHIGFKPDQYTELLK